MSRFKILKTAYPYFLVEDTSNPVTPYAVFIKTEYGFSQQISKWYCYKGTAESRYNKYIKEATMKILKLKEEETLSC